jgi:WD40 repeat protein
MLIGINSLKGSEIVSINLDSGLVNTTPINCYIVGSTVYDPKTGGYGYVDCDTVFRLTDPQTGDVLKSFSLPGHVSQAVIDSEHNLLVGRYGLYTYIDDPDSSNNATLPVFHNYLLRASLESGTVVTNVEIDLGEGVYVCSNYFDPMEKLYVMERADNNLIYINPSTGSIVKTLNIGKPLNNLVYNSAEKTIIALTINPASGENFIEVYDPGTGEQISNKKVSELDNYQYCIAGYDEETNCYITVSSDDEVMFIDVSAGEILKTYKLDYHLSDVKFLRR